MAIPSQSVSSKVFPVPDFTRVARGRGLDLDYDRSERLAKLLKSENPGNPDEIAKLLGLTPGKTKP
jgi:hypothetical protein